MLVLMHPDFAETRLSCVVGPRFGHVVLTPDDAGGTQWRRLHSEDCLPLRDWLRNWLKPRPGRNRVVVIWRQIGTDFAQLMRALPSNEPDYDVSVAALLVGPFTCNSAERGFEADSLQWGDISPRLWFLGREDSSRKATTEMTREWFVDGVLQLMGAVDDERAVEMGIWDEGHGHGVVFESVPALQSTNLPPCTFAVPGLAFWATDLAEYPRFISRLVLDMLQTELEGTTAQREEAFLAQFARTLVSRLRDHDIPYGGSADGSAPPRLSQRFEAPTDPSAGWACPLLRNKALTSGRVMLRLARRHAQDYYHTLLQNLSANSNEIRLQGATAAERARGEVREQIEACGDLSRLVMLLRVFFPPFEEIWRQRFQVPKRVCEPAQAPSWSDVERDAIEAADRLLVSGASDLPSTLAAIVTGAAVICSFLLSAFLSSRGFTTWIAFTPAALSSGIALAGFALSWWRARTVSLAIQTHLIESFTGLRERFVRKAEWIIDNTHLAAQTETVAHAQTLARRLQRNFDDFLGDWRNVIRNSSGPHTEIPAGWREHELFEGIQEKIHGSADLIRRSVLDDQQHSACIDAVHRLLAQLSAMAYQLGVHNPQHPSIAEKELFLLASSLTQPPLAARLETYKTQGKLSKVFALPQNYPHDWDSQLVSRSYSNGVPAKVVRAAFPGPFVWVSCAPLTEDEFWESLRTVEF